MTYIVNEKCVNCRFTDCVEVCPVDHIHIGENTIVIPDECIDCGVCESECPSRCNPSDTDMNDNLQYWLDQHKIQPKNGPNITQKVFLKWQTQMHGTVPTGGYDKDKRNL